MRIVRINKIDYLSSHWLKVFCLIEIGKCRFESRFSLWRIKFFFLSVTVYSPSVYVYCRFLHSHFIKFFNFCSVWAIFGNIFYHRKLANKWRHTKGQITRQGGDIKIFWFNGMSMCCWDQPFRLWDILRDLCLSILQCFLRVIDRTVTIEFFSLFEMNNGSCLTMSHFRLPNSPLLRRRVFITSF